MEKPAKEGDSPVSEKVLSPERIPSTIQHVELVGNLGRPLSKAKYSLATDSELSTVKERWKEPREGSEIEPETVSLQAVGGLCISSLTIYLLHNEPASYCLKLG